MTTSPAAAVVTHRGRFRGWWIVLWCTVVRGLTAPGQTIGVSAFTDDLIDDLGVSRSTISTAYLVGTLTGAVALPAIGRWVDRVGIRRSMTVVGISFATVVALTGSVQNIVMLAMAFVGLRMLGQGSLTLISATGVSLWFDRRRGTALAISATVSIGLLSLAPLTFATLIDAVGWRLAWMIIGAVVALVVVPIARFALVDRPEDLGQRPDGVMLAHGDTPPPVPAATTASAALRTPAFWTLGALTALMATTITGLTFHNTDLLGDQGLTKAQAAAVFIPQMVGSVGTGFVFGALSDRVPARILMPVAGALLAVGLFLATVASPGFGAFRYGLVTGLGVGAVSALGTTLLPKWYGTAHIGSIKGISLSVGVAASALGPLLLSVGKSLSGSYEPVVVASALVTAAVAALSSVVATPAPPTARG